jgi:predicted acetyltransferase
MSIIRALTADEAPAAARILINADPSWRVNSDEERNQSLAWMVGRIAASGDTIYGLFREERLLGVTRLLRLRMNVRDAQVLTGGVSIVAVDLAHKKEKVAHDLMRFCLNRCRAEGMPLAALYPFRPDFYRRMGFGYGAPSTQYAVAPDSLPNTGDKTHVRLLIEDDTAAMRDSYARVQARTHGLMVKSETDMRSLLTGEARAVGVVRDGIITGYLSFTFENDPERNSALDTLHVKELVYETPEALGSLLAFLRSQVDQVYRVAIETQDEYIHHLFSDPRDTSGRIFPFVAHQVGARGLGVMYRVTDTRMAIQTLAGRRFGAERCRVAITVRDSLLPENDGVYVIQLEEGRARLVVGDGYDVAIALDVADFSSLFMGVIDATHLHRYGLAEVSDPARVETLDQIFATPSKPICTTAF